MHCCGVELAGNGLVTVLFVDPLVTLTMPAVAAVPWQTKLKSRAAEPVPQQRLPRPCPCGPPETAWKRRCTKHQKECPRHCHRHKGCGTCR